MSKSIEEIKGQGAAHYVTLTRQPDPSDHLQSIPAHQPGHTLPLIPDHWTLLLSCFLSGSSLSLVLHQEGDMK